MFKNIALSQDEMSVILGGLLGDSYLRKGNRNSIVFSQSIKQKEYLYWKYNIVKNISSVPTDYVDTLGYTHSIFYTNSNKYLRNNLYSPLKVLIYNNDKKTVNRKWLNMLTPISLAVWWMDDGCLSIWKGNRYGKLCTHSFSLKEHEIIKRYFKIVWDVDIQIKVEKHKYYFCRLNVTNLKKFISIIYPYVIQIPSMVYKVNLNYKNNVDLGNFENIYNEIKSHTHDIK